MFSSKNVLSQMSSPPVAEFQYRQTVTLQMEADEVVEQRAAEDHEVRITEESLRKSLAAERSAAIAETEGRLRAEYDQRARAETQRMSKVIEDFDRSRKEYFAKVEREVVQLALSIAGKIIHRESQVDPMLVAALVQIALGQLKDGAAACIRVRPEEVKRWREHFSAQNLTALVSVVEDADLQQKDCILETELGSVNFSLDVQLKEVERGFFDVLAQRPGV